LRPVEPLDSCSKSFQVCTTPDDYLGYYSLLGICTCKTEDLEEVCNLECRKAQENRVQVVCPEEPDEPYIKILDETGNIYVSS
jgi:hypothetical protein